MKTSSVSLLLGVCELLLSALAVSAASLTISPNLQQFFEGASVSLTCEGQVGSDGWTLKRDTGRGTESCGAGGRGLTGSSCFLEVFKPISGVYWCEDKAGEKSEEVNITVSDPPTTTSLTTITTATSNTNISYHHPPPPSFIVPVVAAVVSLVLVVLLLVVVQLLWKKHTGRTQPSPSTDDVIYNDVTIRESANKMPVSQSEVVYSNLRTNTTGN